VFNLDVTIRIVLLKVYISQPPHVLWVRKSGVPPPNPHTGFAPTPLLQLEEGTPPKLYDPQFCALLCDICSYRGTTHSASFPFFLPPPWALPPPPPPPRSLDLIPSASGAKGDRHLFPFFFYPDDKKSPCTIQIKDLLPGFWLFPPFFPLNQKRVSLDLQKYLYPSFFPLRPYIIRPSFRAVAFGSQVFNTRWRVFKLLPSN